MKTIILAGGFGTRLAEYTKLIPKPMVEIGGKPILWHIMNLYASYGYNEGNDDLTTEFYLDWDANAAVVTAIDDINGNVGEVSLRPGVGGMEVVGPAGQTFGVYDMAGRLVQQVTTDQTGRATIDGLTPGIYIVAGEKAQVR